MKKAKLDEAKEYDEIKMEEISNVQKNLSWFGPISIIAFILVQSCSCGMLMCCYYKYKNYLVKYETSPHNPMNNNL
jgi:hypothetical protein